MRNHHANTHASVAIYASPPHVCAYLPEREAVTQFIDPAQSMSNALYGQLIDRGFRRSGEFVYRPACPACQACIAVRVPVNDFRPSRSQRRAWHRNQDLHIKLLPGLFSEEHYALYRRYITTRHPGGGMDNADPAQFREFLFSPWSNTYCYEFRLGEALLAVAVVDRLTQGLSAVYTYFDPDQEKRSLGVYAILHQIHEAKRRGLPYLYLGYWIASCPKMSYKNQYRPLEIFRDGHWQHLP